MSLKQFKILTLLLFISSSPLIEGSENSTQDLTIAKYEIMNELIRDHGFDEQYVNNIFDEVEFLPELIESISRPAEKTKSWQEYRSIFLTPKRIAEGVRFAKQHKE